MPSKLSTPISVATPIGTVSATHQLHNINIVDNEAGTRIISTKQLAVEHQGKLTPVGEAISVDITDPKDIVAASTISNISSIHDRVSSERVSAQKVELENRKKELEKQIEEAQARLKALG